MSLPIYLVKELISKEICNGNVFWRTAYCKAKSISKAFVYQVEGLLSSKKNKCEPHIKCCQVTAVCLMDFTEKCMQIFGLTALE